MTNLRLTSAELASVAEQAGFAKGAGLDSGGLANAAATDILETAIAVSFAENGLHIVGLVSVPNSDGTVDLGLWQINSGWTEKAHWGNQDQKVYSRSQLLSDPLYNATAAYEISKGGTDWGAWTTYKNGKYQSFLPQAKAAIQFASDTGPTGFQSWADKVHVPNPLSWGEALAHALSRLASGSFWKRVGFYAVGIVFLLFAGFIIFRRSIPKVVPV